MRNWSSWAKSVTPRKARKARRRVVTRMIVANVLHRPVRTIISVLAVAIEVGMVMLVVGMTTGLLHEAAKRVEGVGADVLVQPPGSSFLIGLGSAPVPIKIAQRLEEMPHVQAVAPALLQTNLGEFNHNVVRAGERAARMIGKPARH